jgi:hypothetical protein
MEGLMRPCSAPLPSCFHILVLVARPLFTILLSKVPTEDTGSLILRLNLSTSSHSYSSLFSLIGSDTDTDSLYHSLYETY